MTKSHRRQLKRMRLKINHRLMNDASAPTRDTNGNRLGLRKRMAVAGFTDIKAFNQAMSDTLEKLASSSANTEKADARQNRPQPKL